MDELKLELADKERLLKKEQKTLDTFYPNWDDWLSNNHKRTYNKLVNRINTLTQEIQWLIEQIESFII